MGKYLTAVIFIFGLYNLSYTQSLKAYEKKAEEAFNSGDYSGALVYNQILIEIDSQRYDAYYKCAESARMIRSYKVAEKYYEAIPEMLWMKNYQLITFRLATVKKRLGKYEEAISYFEKFIDTNCNVDYDYVKRAITEVEVCEWAMENQNSGEKYEVAILDSTVNTSFSDYAPFKMGDKLYYSSAYFEGKNSNPTTKIFQSNFKERGFIIPENSQKNGSHTANFSVNMENTKMFYSVCEEISAKDGFKCKIFMREKRKDGNWGSPIILPSTINMQGYTATQPSIGYDEESKKEILFFSSNRPGGKGKMDIWYCLIGDNNSFENPQNVFSINTEEDDITPHFYSPSQVLFFSSKGYRGYGGFDVYRTQKTGNVFFTPENMGYPLNSSYDELYYFLDAESRKAYMTSNRSNVYCPIPDKDCSCNDIFEVEMFVDIFIRTYNSVDSSELTGVKLELIDIASGSVDTFEINELGNSFNFPLDLGKEYNIRAFKDGFEPVSVDFSTSSGVYHSKTISKKLYLIPQIDLIVNVYDAISGEPITGVEVGLTNLITKTDSSQLNMETNSFHFLLSYGDDFRLRGAKAGFSTNFENFTTAGINKPKTITKEIYLSRFDYLPFSVYFFNDEPNPNTEKETTNLSYSVCYQSYYDMKETFISNYTQGFVSIDKELKTIEVEDFFEDYVKAGYEKLKKFTGNVCNYFKGKNVLEIVVEGYASPLAEEKYNVNLTKRRISSVENFLLKYQNGYLKPYFDAKMIKITESPRGENLAPEGISDDKSNEQKSIYSIEASKERKVRVIDVRWKKDVTTLY